MLHHCSRFKDGWLTAYMLTSRYPICACPKTGGRNSIVVVCCYIPYLFLSIVLYIVQVVDFSRFNRFTSNNSPSFISCYTVLIMLIVEGRTLTYFICFLVGSCLIYFISFNLYELQVLISHEITGYVITTLLK